MSWDYTIGSILGLFSLAILYVIIKSVADILDRVLDMVVISREVEESPLLKAEFRNGE